MGITNQNEITLDSILNSPLGFKYNGLDNNGMPKIEYVQKILKMNEEELLEETERKIWLSAYANNNARSDYHWQCDACYAVSFKYGNLYERAYKNVESTVK